MRGGAWSVEMQHRDHSVRPVECSRLRRACIRLLARTIHGAAHLLRLDPRTVPAMVRAGQLASGRHGHTIRVSGPSGRAWLRGRRRVLRLKR
jgi:hypothetical protein